MRKITFGGANSLDNYFARKDHSVDWLLPSKESGQIMAAYWKTIDTILMGRKTYEVALRMSHGKNPYMGIKTYVFSKTLNPKSGKHVIIVSSDACDFIRQLKGQPGKDICMMGGGELAKSMLEAGLIDELGFNIHPVLLGSGVPMFHQMSRQIDLALIESRSLKNGCVYVRYRVKSA
jgi:dihydrofolate reductase